MPSKAVGAGGGNRRSDGGRGPPFGGTGTIGLVRIDRAGFEDLVAEAMDAVPEPFAAALDEVAVVVEDHAPPGMGELYGLYVGIPLSEGVIASGALPPRIAIYMHPLLEHCDVPAELVEQVRITVLHELGHHLGFDERELDELGYA